MNDLWKFSDGDWSLVQPGSGRDDGTRPGPRLVSACAILDGELLLFGGWDPQTAGTGGVILDDVWALDLSTLQWKKCTDMPYGPTSRHVACAVGNRLLVHTFRCTESILVWSPSLRKLVEQPTSGTPPSSRGLHAAAAVGDHTLVVFGGAAKDGAMSNEAFALDTRTWEWRGLAAPSNGLANLFNRSRRPTPRAGACAASTEDGIIMCCGAESAVPIGLCPRGDCWKLTVPEDGGEATWEMLVAESQEDAAAAMPGAPGPRNAATLTPLPDGKLLLHGGWRPFKSTYGDSFALG